MSVLSSFNNIVSTQEVLDDYYLANLSREASLLGRKEVFMGKAKFGIFGDGKELAQIAMSKVFQNGDFRSGYYRDQTFMFAIGQLSIQEYFAQLYAHTNLEFEPSSAGRLMNGHFSTRLLNEIGEWKNLLQEKHSSSDVSPTASQMPRLLGLAYASKLYRHNSSLSNFNKFSNNGNEVAFGTIGNASTSEGMFFECINAAGVLQVPMLVSVWDDDYGISVYKELQTCKGSISQALKGFKPDNLPGVEVYTVQGWNYIDLIKTYQEASELTRKKHVPVIVHVTQMTQPQGHSTSGSHERYKTKERLEWEKENDCIIKFQEWILNNKVATSGELTTITSKAKSFAKLSKEKAWNDFDEHVQRVKKNALDAINQTYNTSKEDSLLSIAKSLTENKNPLILDSYKAVKQSLWRLKNKAEGIKKPLLNYLNKIQSQSYDSFNSHLYSTSRYKSSSLKEISPIYTKDCQSVDGREVLLKCFDLIFSTYPEVFAIGEDVGKIGDVNQAFAGLQEKYGEIRITDTGIRECSIVGQGIGAALRGLRPIVEIQYLDYLLYAIQILSDDLATLYYRTKGGQKAPLIIRTRGHRLEGMWHSGSPMGMIIHSLRGINILTPRNMTQAARYYNSILQTDEPALIIECLNGYRIKEKLPSNVGEMTLSLGKVEMLNEGFDVTVVTYGSMCRLVMEATQELQKVDISVEVIDIQSLIPFDLDKDIVKSVIKTNRLVVADEDVPGGASSYILQQILEEQDAYHHLDSKPITITAKEHRPAYSSDGNYFSKPNVEEIFEKIYQLMSEVNPIQYPSLY